MDESSVGSSRSVSWKSVLDVTTSGVVIAAALFLVWSNLSSRSSGRPQLAIPAEPVSIAGGASKGSPAAPLVLIAYSDFQCPFCGRFAREVLPGLEQEYITSGRVQFVYRHLPLPSHQYAMKAAHAAACAGAQDRFWPMHDQLFAQGAQLDDAGLRRMSAALQLDGRTFESCIDNASTTAVVTRDATEARALGLNSTPSFLLGARLSNGSIKVTRAFSGTLPIASFRAELDQAAASHGESWFWRWF